MQTHADTIQQRERRAHPPRRKRKAALRLLLLIAILALGWAFAEPFMLTRTHAVVSSPDVPAQLNGLRIVFVSDIHAGVFYGPRRLSRLVDEINAAKPDLIILGGDYVGGYSGGLNTFYSAARKLDPSIGIVAVMGNHDGWEGAIRSRTALEGINASVLDNRNIRVTRRGESIIVAGVDDPETGSPSIAQAASGISAEDYAILVSHSPDVFVGQLRAHAEAFDLALAGHNHGGQVTIFGAYAPVLPSEAGNDYRSGWLQQDGVDMLITRGVGTVCVPVRFFSPPEIVVLDLKRGTRGIEETR